MAKTITVTMDSDVFEQMKQNMTDTMNKMLRSMMEYGAEEATMNLKLTISLEKRELDEGEIGIAPTFKNKVTSNVQIKSEMDGKLGGDYILENDGNGGYILRPTVD